MPVVAVFISEVSLRSICCQIFINHSNRDVILYRIFRMPPCVAEERINNPPTTRNDIRNVISMYICLNNRLKIREHMYQNYLIIALGSLEKLASFC